MSRRKVTRRQFLLHAATGAGAVAGVVATETLAGQGVRSAMASPSLQAHGHEPAAVASQQATAAEHFLFFNTPQGRTVDAIAARMIPTDTLGPGAREAGVVFYIDRALAGPYVALQEVYRAGLAALDAYSEARYGAPFRNLAEEQQDAVLRDLETGSATGFTAPTAQEFFNLLWVHVREGMFCDPAHGGNRDFIGWRLLRYPGVQWEHSAEEQWNGPAPDKPLRAAGDWGFRL
ncbi:MAG TPA: gluconate 2-dehydrogenase subunit 3 family protein [Chloroflexota bacterium]|nr:gluconate 2-dehydrogenase subunit 3 family protein [Chloroflexota bacterium]